MTGEYTRKNDKVLIDKNTATPVLLPYDALDFRGDPATIVDFAAPRHSNSSGRVYTADGGEYFPSVFNLEIR